MLRTTIWLTALALAAGVLAGCGGDDDEDEAREATTALTDTAGAAESVEEALETAGEALENGLTLDFREQNNSGIGGTVAFELTSEGTVEVEIELTGSGAGPHPAHVHAGSCADLDPTPKWPLNNVVNGRSKTTLDVSLADVTASEYAVNVHESPENAARYVACADLRNQ